MGASALQARDWSKDRLRIRQSPVREHRAKSFLKREVRMVRLPTLSREILPPINLDWAGDVNIFLDFGDSTFSILLIVALIAYVSAINR